MSNEFPMSEHAAVEAFVAAEYFAYDHAASAHGTHVNRSPSCGCFDGHHVDGDRAPVAIRCDRHVLVAPLIPGATVRGLAEVRISRLLPPTALELRPRRNPTHRQPPKAKRQTRHYAPLRQRR